MPVLLFTFCNLTSKENVQNIEGGSAGSFIAPHAERTEA